MRHPSVRTIATWCLLCLAVAALAAQPVRADSVSTLYDMNRMLSEPHPFANQMGTHWQPLALAAVQPVAAPLPAGARAPARAMPAAASGTTPAPIPAAETEARYAAGSFGWISEVRAGVLKHAVSLIGNTTKETGVDGNLEVLFTSPDWLGWLWSPRPTVGVTANASSSNTDIGYAGLTWEWKPWDWLFLNFSFGGAVHNGKLKYDANVEFPADAGRHREFGCRALFRESFEAGWQFARHHAISLMWSHYSHGGLCDDKNEGLDNAGVRYGYRF